MYCLPINQVEERRPVDHLRDLLKELEARVFGGHPALLKDVDEREGYNKERDGGALFT
jgi:NAD(P)H-dependent FMN reductase